MVHFRKRFSLKLQNIQELYRQQKYMYDHKTHSVEDRIVSISQPHVRPVVRGKARANVEFGAKLAISVVDGFAYMEKLSWNNYNEAMTLKEAIERYKNHHGFYPESLQLTAFDQSLFSGKGKVPAYIGFHQGSALQNDS